MIYSQKNISSNKFERVFSSDVPETELKWHRDKENRLVEVLKDTDWYFQMDNELPIPLKKGVKFEIPKETYHRVIKGTGDLKILIEEY
jgi:hypothetical protein